MSLVKSFDAMAKGHLPKIHTYLDIIIKHNQKDPNSKAPGDKSKASPGDVDEEMDGSRVFADGQQGRVAKAVLQRKGDEASSTLFARQQDKSGVLPHKDEMDQAWKDSPAGKFHQDARQRMKDGIDKKLQDVEQLKRDEEAKAQQAKVDKDLQYKAQMVGASNAGKIADRPAQIDRSQAGC